MHLWPDFTIERELTETLDLPERLER